MNKSKAAADSNDFHTLRFHCKSGTVSPVNISMRNSPIFQLCTLRLRELSPLPRSYQLGSSSPPDTVDAPLASLTAGLAGEQEQGVAGEPASVLVLLVTDPDLQPALFTPRSYYEESSACAPGQQGCDSGGCKRFGEPNT